MSRSRRADRVLAGQATTGAAEFDAASSLPRSRYRDIEAFSGTYSPELTGFPSRATARWMATGARGVPRSGASRALFRALRGFGLPPRLTSRFPGGKSLFVGELPSRLRYCVRREQRRQVLFAKRVAGRRGGSPGPYRRSFYSQYSCGR